VPRNRRHRASIGDRRQFIPLILNACNRADEGRYAPKTACAKDSATPGAIFTCQTAHALANDPQ
jgi:hypothetical protein